MGAEASTPKVQRTLPLPPIQYATTIPGQNQPTNSDDPSNLKHFYTEIDEPSDGFTENNCLGHPQESNDWDDGDDGDSDPEPEPAQTQSDEERESDYWDSFCEVNDNVPPEVLAEFRSEQRPAPNVPADENYAALGPDHEVYMQGYDGTGQETLSTGFC